MYGINIKKTLSLGRSGNGTFSGWPSSKCSNINELFAEWLVCLLSPSNRNWFIYCLGMIIFNKNRRKQTGIMVSSSAIDKLKKIINKTENFCEKYFKKKKKLPNNPGQPKRTTIIGLWGEGGLPRLLRLSVRCRLFDPLSTPLKKII